jgi:hypothetical protein
MIHSYFGNRDLHSDTTIPSDMRIEFCSPLHLNNISSISGNILVSNGGNDYGQLGINSEHDTINPCIVSLENGVPLINVKQLSCGNNHTMVLTNDGILYSFGCNEYGQLGDGTLVNRRYPIKFIINDRIKSVACGGDHTLILMDDSSGTVYSFGSNEFSQLGINASPDLLEVNFSQIPIKILDGISHISAGESHSVVITKNGTLLGWGDNQLSQLGFIYPLIVKTPTKLTYSNGEDIVGVSQVSCGNSHTLIILSQYDTIVSFGNNIYGQLGNSGSNDVFPDNVVYDSHGRKMANVKQIACGNEHSVALLQNGDIYSWGSNDNGQLGIDKGEKSFYNYPQKIPLCDVESVSCGNFHTLFLTKHGYVYGCGRNDFSQLGHQSSIRSINTPTLINSLNFHNIIVCGGGEHTCVVGSKSMLMAIIKNGEDVSVILRFPSSIDINDQLVSLKNVKTNMGTLDGFQIQLELTYVNGKKYGPIIGMLVVKESCENEIMWALPSSSPSSLHSSMSFVNTIKITFKYRPAQKQQIDPPLNFTHPIIMVDSFQSVLCGVSNDTVITLANGTMRMIKNIKRGDIVKGYNNVFKVARVISHKICNNFPVKLITILPSSISYNQPNRRLIIDPDHKIICNGCVCSLSNLENQSTQTCTTAQNILISNDDTISHNQYYMYDLQFETEGSYCANGLYIISISPRSPYYYLSKEMYFNRKLY